jgi:hypothetical protein
MFQASGSSPLENIVQLSSGEFGGYIAMNLLIIDHLAAIIIFEHSFYIHDKRCYLWDPQESVTSFELALEQYIASPHADAVKKAVRVAVHTRKGTSSSWTGKLPFARFQKKRKQPIQPIGDSQKMELIKTILQITLEHRLRMFDHYVVANNHAHLLVFSKTLMVLGNSMQSQRVTHACD